MPSQYPNTYKMYYNQGTTLNNHTSSNFLNLSGTIKDCLTSNLLQANTPWESSNSYCGAQMNDNTLIGKYSSLSYKSYQDYSEFSVEKKSTTGTANIRMAGLWCSGFTSYGSFHQTYRWTNLPTSLTNIYNNTNYNANFSYIDPFYQGLISKYLASSPNNNIFGTTFFNNLNLNELIFLPYFNFVTYKLSGKETDEQGNTVYKEVSQSNVNNYTWEQIKPEDETPAGQYYDEDIWNQGYHIITQDDTSITVRVLTGATASAFYGKSDNFYSAGSYTRTGSYTQRYPWGTGNAPSTDERPSGSYGNRATCIMCPIVEYYNADMDSVMYTSLPGWNFALNSSGANTNFSFPEFTYNNSFTKHASPSTGLHCLTNPYSTSLLGIQNSSSLDDANPKIINTAIQAECHYKLPFGPNTNNAYRYTFDNGFINYYRGGYYQHRAGYVSIFPLKMLWGTLASLGCFVAANLATAQYADLENRRDNPYLYLGHMGVNGVTDGVMLQGSDIVNPPQLDFEDIINNTPYQPVIPGPDGGGGGADDPTNDNFEHNKALGDSVPHNYNDIIAGAGTTVGTSYISLDNGSLLGLAHALSDPAQVTTFWDKLIKKIEGQTNDGSTTTSYDLSVGSDSSDILNYLKTLRMYPFTMDNSSNGIDVEGSNSFTKINFGFNGAHLTPNPHNFHSINRTIGIFDFGTVTLPLLQSTEGFWDYEPYTSVSVTLPGIGTFPINAKLAIGNTLSLNYVVDIATGQASANIYTTIDGIEIPVLCKTGQIGIDIGISGNNKVAQADNMANAELNNMSTMLGKTIPNAVKGVAGAGLAKAASGVIGGVGTLAGFGTLINSAAQTATDIAQGGLQLAQASRDVPNTVTSSSGIGSLAVTRYAYITIRRPYFDIPSNFGHTVGYLLKASGNLGTFSGYTVCANVDVTGISRATSVEKNLIKQLLENGVYV